MPEDYVCVNPNNQPISPSYYSQCFKKFLRDHGLREVRLHDLRHTCASLLIQNRTPLIEVQQWLGHSTLETTANLYAHLEYETKINSAEAVSFQKDGEMLTGGDLFVKKGGKIRKTP